MGGIGPPGSLPLAGSEALEAEAEEGRGGDLGGKDDPSQQIIGVSL